MAIVDVTRFEEQRKIVFTCITFASVYSLLPEWELANDAGLTESHAVWGLSVLTR